MQVNCVLRGRNSRSIERLGVIGVLSVRENTRVIVPIFHIVDFSLVVLGCCGFSPL